MKHSILPWILCMAAGGIAAREAAAVELVPDTSYGRDGLATLPDDPLSGGRYGYIFLPPPSVLLPEGAMLFAGTAADGTIRVLKLDASGRLDGSFGTGGRVTVPMTSATGGTSVDLVAYPDGKILVAGPAPDGGVRILRLRADGTIDDRFGDAGHADHALPGAEGPSRSVKIALDAAQRVRVVASCDPIKVDIPGTCAARSWRLLPEGGADAGFADTAIGGSAFGTSYPLSIAVMADDSSFALLEEPEDIMDNHERLVRFMPDGGLDAAFSSDNLGAQLLAILGSGSTLYVSRQVYQANGVRSGAMSRLFASGEIDRSFGSAGTLSLVDPSTLGSSSAFVVALARDGDARVLGAGALLASSNASSGALLTRIDHGGTATVDASFGRAGYVQLPLPFTFWSGETLGRDRAGRVLLAGFRYVGPGEVPMVARLFEVDPQASGNPGVLMFAGLGASVTEDQGSVQIRVLRTGGSRGAASVRYETRAGTATSGVDYLPTQGRLDWADGDASDRVITIALLADREIEGTEKFVLALSDPSGASLGLLAQFEVVIEASTAQGVVPTSVAPTGSTVASNGGGGGGGGGAIDPSLTGALLAWWAMRVRRGNFRAPMVRDATTG